MAPSAAFAPREHDTGLNTLEFRLVAMCAFLDRKAWETQRSTVLRLLDQGLKVDRFVALVKRHRVQRLAYEVLKRAAADAGINLPWISEQLLPAARKVQLRGLALHAEWHRIQAVFRHAGVGVQLLKGTTLSERLYDDIGMRHCRDLDIVVAPKDVELACVLLERSGYSVHHILPDNLRQGYHLRLCRLLERHVTCELPKRHTCIELHWRMEEMPWSHLNQAWAACLAQAAAGDIPWSHFDLLYCCLHGASHAWMRLKWLGDVRVLAGGLQADEWPAILSLASELKMEAILAQALMLLHDVCGFSIPLNAAELVRQQQSHAVELVAEGLEWLALAEEDLAEDSLASIWRARRRRARLYYRYRTPERIAHRLATMFFSITDLQKFRLPAWLLPLYPVIRPFSVCSRFLAGASSVSQQQI